MQSNDTKTISEADLQRAVVNYGIYLTIGGLAFASNLLILVVIWWHRVLREKKEWLVLSAMVCMDMLQGFAYASAGGARLLMIHEGTANQLMTRLQCLLKPWNLIFFNFNGAYGANLLMVSVDRLISMSEPLRYYTFGRLYALCMVVFFNLPYIPISVIEMLKTLEEDRAFLAQICYTTWVYVDRRTIVYLQRQASVLAWASSIVYVAVVVQYHRKMKKMMTNLSEEVQRQRLHSQRKLMVTLGISCVCTVVLYISPSYVLSVMKASSQVMSTVSAFMLFNHMVNPILLILRHKPIGRAVSCLFSGKKFTQEMLVEAGLKKLGNVKFVEPKET